MGSLTQLSHFVLAKGLIRDLSAVAKSLGITPKVPFSNKMMTGVSPYIT